MPRVARSQWRKKKNQRKQKAFLDELKRRHDALTNEFHSICMEQRIGDFDRLCDDLERENVTISQEVLCEEFQNFVFQQPKRGVDELIQAARDIFFSSLGLDFNRISTEVYWKLFSEFNTTVILRPWLCFFLNMGLEMSTDDISLYHLFDELCMSYRWGEIRKEVFHLGLELCVVECGLYINIPSPEVECIEQKREILLKACNRNSEFLSAGIDPDNADDGFVLDPEEPEVKIFQSDLYESYHSYRSLYFRTCTGRIHFQAICDAVRCYFIHEKDAFDAITPVITEFMFGSVNGFLNVTRTFPSKSPSLCSTINLGDIQPMYLTNSRETSTLSDVGTFI